MTFVRDFHGQGDACRKIPGIGPLNPAIGKYVIHYYGKAALQCLLLIAGIKFPGFVNKGVGYPRSGNDQWVGGNPESLPEIYRNRVMPEFGRIGNGPLAEGGSGGAWRCRWRLSQ
jgi:hypothetical protein